MGGLAGGAGQRAAPAFAASGDPTATATQAFGDRTTGLVDKLLKRMDKFKGDGFNDWKFKMIVGMKSVYQDGANSP